MPKRSTTATPAFPTLINRQQYQQRASEVFRSQSSLDWFIRAHRAELAQHGAIVKLAGEVLIDEGKFPDVAKTIGSRLARIGGGSGE